MTGLEVVVMARGGGGTVASVTAPLLMVSGFSKGPQGELAMVVSRTPKYLVENKDFQHILCVLNINIDGKQKIMFAITFIKGIVRQFTNICCKKVDIRMNKRLKYKDGKYSQPLR
ncbi:uncharacterized protein [Arachis hypogaea]|uniref:uncharacterized protein n=1 Tax=Arachis hypogaea TaxID=3818 RepID=UPI003B221B58